MTLAIQRDLNKRHILIVDDDQMLRKTIVAALQANGFATLEADNGVMGVKLARAHLPDLILSDINMEEMNGYGLLEKLRSDLATVNTPLILMTGQANLPGMRQGMMLGADDYLAKPFTQLELVQAVNARLLRVQALREEADKKLNELRTSITMMLPHELLTPLSGIVGVADLISSEGKSLGAAELAEFGQALQEAARRLEHLIKNFLIYAQVELLAADTRKAEELRRRPTVDASVEVQAVAHKKAADWGRKDDLVMDFRPLALPVPAEFLAKIVEELLDNAFKFSKPGSQVFLVNSCDGRNAMIQVNDSGRGMKNEYRTNIGAYMQFERKLYEQQGTGLGLAIAKRLVDLFGGEMKIQSQLEKGTAVRMDFPMHEES